MSFFNLRRGGSSSKSKAGAKAPVASIDLVRKRAKHRLIGAAVLVLLGVVGFPLLFDTQPRPVPVDIAIDIPAKNAVKPLVPPPVPAAQVPEVKAVVPLDEEAPVVAAAPTSAAAAAAKADVKIPAKIETKAEAKPDTNAAAKPEAKPVSESARAKALLDGATGSATPAVAPSDVRLVVQVGAYADAAKARDARAKLEKAGLKTYAQVAETKDGKRTRVRIGPFASRAEADKAAAKVKSLDLPASILTL